MNVIPDISFWQDDPTTPQKVDFRVMAQKTPAVILRAGQWTWEDRSFSYNWKAAKEAGLQRGSYWYYDNRGDPKRQAELWVSILGDDLGELEMWCDFEHRAAGAFSGWRKWYDFMERIKQLVPGAKLGVYTGYYYFQEYASGVEYFAQYPLWIAWYNPTEPLIPPIWDDWFMWQYTDDADGTPYGVESREIDLNYRKGELVGESPTGTLSARFGNETAIYQEKG